MQRIVSLDEESAVRVTQVESGPPSEFHWVAVYRGRSEENAYMVTLYEGLTARQRTRLAYLVNSSNRWHGATGTMDQERELNEWRQREAGRPEQGN